MVGLLVFLKSLFIHGIKNVCSSPHETRQGYEKENRTHGYLTPVAKLRMYHRIVQSRKKMCAEKIIICIYLSTFHKNRIFLHFERLDEEKIEKPRFPLDNYLHKSFLECSVNPHVKVD